MRCCSAGVNVAASRNGVLAYRTGASGDEFAMTWFDRAGNFLSEIGLPGRFTNPALSPDEKWLAVGIREPKSTTRDLWLFDLVRQTSTRLTFDAADELNPAWSPDGRHIAFSSDRKGQRDIYVVDASGTREPVLVFQNANPKNLEQWTPDGKYLLVNTAPEKTPSDLYVVRAQGEAKRELGYRAA